MCGLWLDDRRLSQVRRRGLQRRQSVGGHRWHGNDPSPSAFHVLCDELDLSATRASARVQQCGVVAMA